jgi:biopolymer transport protein TolR
VTGLRVLNTVTVTSDGTVLVGSTPVPKDRIVAVIQDLSEGETDRRIYLSGDKDVSYQQVVEIMGLIDAAGFTRIGLLGASGN